MSYTTASAIATLTLPGFASAEEIAQNVYDHLVANPDDAPDELVITGEDDDKENITGTVSSYLSLKDDVLTVAYGTEYDGNYNSGIFYFLTSYLAKMMASPYMEVAWMCDDSRDGMSSGTDYYDKHSNVIDVKAALAAFASRPALIIDAQSGTVLNATHCYAIPAEAAEDDSLDEMSDSEVGDWAREHGTPVIR